MEGRKKEMIMVRRWKRRKKNEVGEMEENMMRKSKGNEGLEGKKIREGKKVDGRRK